MVILYRKNSFKRRFKASRYKNQMRIKFSSVKSLNTHLKAENSPTNNTNFTP